MQVQERSRDMFAAVTPVTAAAEQLGLRARIDRELACRYPAIGDVRRGYFRLGWLDRVNGEPEPLFLRGRHSDAYRAGWDAAAEDDPRILEREQRAAERRRERLGARFDAELEAQKACCRKGVHPAGAREIRGGRVCCTACGRQVRP